ncbi:MAG: VCBS repeat-containing protein [Bacteroidales bacterium]|nr:VCBS repeat-containing protein [Bacteroidales bacterium]MCF8459074.1 VCBS repeat-containing protein [Bacteroidales bacterium]
MKYTITLLINFFLIISFAFSQQLFIPHNVTLGSRPIQITLADVDNDSDLDMLAAYYSDNLLAWYRNNGNGYFDSLKIINDFDIELSGALFASDLDDDGKTDVIAGGNSSLCWYKNLGNGNFGTQQPIDYSVDGVSSIVAIDLDNDSLNDVISASYYDSTIAWYKNLGNGNFGPQQIITSTVTGVYELDIVDLDIDGNRDLLIASYSSNKIAWYKNLGNGSFGTQQIVTSTAEGAFGVKAAYIDNDSLPDVITSQAFGNNDKITWHKNLGNGNFSNEIIINTTLIVPRYFFPADFDNDNDQDLVMGSWSHDTLIWQENLGNGTFGPIQLISNTIDGPNGVYAGDLNGDGFMDIVAGGELSSSIEVYLSHNSNYFALNQTIANATVEARSVFATDLNNNGHKDILSASRGDNKIAWYKNLGNKQFSSQKVISNSMTRAWAVYAADLDNDGYGDVVASGWGDTIAWYKNMQNDSFDLPQNLQGGFGNSTVLMARDIDGDGSIDIIGNVGDFIKWAKNLGNGNFGPLQLLYSLSNLTTFDLQDINSDGYVDIVMGSSSVLAAGLNNGAGNFLVSNIFQSVGAYDLQITDLNDDGYKDILFVAKENSTLNNFVGWYQNDGLGNFPTPVFISYIESYSYTIAAADIDNDGDNDIFTAPRVSTYNIGNLVWFENQGTATFSQSQNIGLKLGRIWDMYITDIDNDYDNDIVFASDNHSSVKWLENTLNNLIDTITICAEDSALIFGNWISQPGDYTDTLQNVQGGDSINIIRLEIYQSYFLVDTIEICDGETYNFYGQVINTAGVYSETFQSVQGCDSIEELSLVVIPAPAVNISPFVPDSVSINAGLLALPAATPTGGTYSGAGITPNGFEPSQAGLGEHWISYSYLDTTTGCTGKDSTLIKVYDPISIDELETNKVKLYPNPGTGDFVLTGTNLQSIQVKTLTGELVKEIEIKDCSEVHFTLAGQAKGIYFVHIVNDDAEIRRLLILI